MKKFALIDDKDQIGRNYLVSAGYLCEEHKDKLLRNDWDHMEDDFRYTNFTAGELLNFEFKILIMPEGLNRLKELAPVKNSNMGCYSSKTE